MNGILFISTKTGACLYSKVALARGSAKFLSSVEPCKGSLFVQPHCPGFGITTKSEGLAFRPAQVNHYKHGLPIFALTLHPACRRTHAISHQILAWSTLKVSALQACCML